MKNKKIQGFRNTFFQKPKFHYKPSCEVENVLELHSSICV
jgi:hypothetical protein